MRPIFWITALIFAIGGGGLVAYALSAEKPNFERITLAAVIGALALGAAIILA